METLRTHIRLKYSLLLSLLAAVAALFVFQGVVVPGFFVAGHGAISELQAARQHTRVVVKAQVSSHRVPVLKTAQISLLFSRFLYIVPLLSVFFSPFRQLIPVVAVAEYSSVPARAPPA